MTRLVRSDELAVEAQDDTHVTVVHHGSAERWRVSRSVHRFLLAFGTPHTLAEVIGGEPPAALVAQVAELVARGLLLDADAPPVSRAPLCTAVAYRFAGAPACPRAQGPNNCVDFVVLGVPYDLGGAIECRLAAAAIRQKSLDYVYAIDFSTGLPRGWFDAGRCQRILEGKTFGDAGDVRVDYGEPQRELFARIGRVLDDVAPPCAVPVVLGGDRSITFAVADHLRRRGPLSVIQLAGQAAVAGAPADFVTADGVAARLAQLAGIDAVVSVGDRDGDPHGEQSAAGVTLWSAAFARTAGPAALASRLGTDRAVYLSIDLGVTARDYARLHGGLALAELAEAVRAIGAAHRIVAIDLVGLDVSRSAAPVAIAAACHLALCAMSAACDRPRSWS